MSNRLVATTFAIIRASFFRARARIIISPPLPSMRHASTVYICDCDCDCDCRFACIGRSMQRVTVLLLKLVPIIAIREWRPATSELMSVEVPGSGDAKISQGQPQALRPLASMYRVSVPQNQHARQRYQSVNSSR